MSSVKPARETPAHHVGNPPTSFQNPWPSFTKQTPWNLLSTRFGRNRNFIPVPSRAELVKIRTPDWGAGQKGLKVTWIGHATFVVETTAFNGAARGVRLLFDPVWSERTSPVTWVGPKRYTPTPCTLQELPDMDLVVLSHNHYDHTDLESLRAVHRIRKENVRFLCALGNAALLYSLGIPPQQVVELDWWDISVLDVPGVGAVRLTCTPSQHMSGRGILDQGCALWCSWTIEEVEAQSSPMASKNEWKKLFFAGDTGYRSVPYDHSPDESEVFLPHCPAFAEIGQRFGPFDLALLPIGLYSPRSLMSSVHCNPEDSVSIHKDIKSKKSIGMHWGTVRGGISAQYEDVREPPRRWREATEKNGLVWDKEVGLLDIGETLVIE